MPNDLTDQLRSYFSDIDARQDPVDIASLGQLRSDEAQLLSGDLPDQRLGNDRPHSRWLVPAAILVAVTMSLLLLRDTTGTTTAAGPLSGTIVFEAQDRNADRLTDIYMMDIESSRTTRLTDHPGPDRHPSWSPDGSQVVFDSNRAPLGEDVGIYIMNADGTEVTRVGTGYAPEWSPTGDKILYQGPGGIFTMAPDGSDSMLVAEGMDPSWSPDGTRIVYSRRTRSSEPLLNAELFTIHTDGTDEAQLTNTPNQDEFLPSWSPTGTQIAYRSDNLGVSIIDANGSNTRQVLGDHSAWSPISWSPDGRYLSYLNLIVTERGPTPAGLVMVDAETLQIIDTLQTEPQFISSFSWR